ncbi:MAG: deoxyribodipyrimidine photo-lyase [Armatimonadota bacterium]|nr:deoxyribodipyrimidine photo-lyase [Armatimonadota bacterium]MDR7548401.1 deoxyribodipyrimidine photo-lyase [Armatimonadota bacterium]
MAVWWIRRDLRLHDNPALAAALERGRSVVPLFILDPALLSSPDASPGRTAFLFAGLRTLDQDLRARGGRLVVRRGRPHHVLAQVVRETGAEVIVAQADVSPYARRRDARVAAHLPLQLVGGVTVLPPDRVRGPEGSPYRIFTPFRRAWEAAVATEHLAPIAPPSRLAVPETLATEEIPASDPGFEGFPPGEQAARKRLAAFAAGADAPIYRYAATRDRVDLDGTSRLSPYLRFGMVSAREVLAAAHRAMHDAPDVSACQSARVYIGELIWREFYAAILRHFPHVLEQEFRPALRGIRWNDDLDGLAAWQAGLTGFPIVDAAMRQLARTGWIPNRARMIVASFLVKDLLIDWRHGEQHFMRLLLDGDPAANTGGWQWTAGVGTDAAPYFRAFNPTLQGRRADPHGAYVRRWVPELARVPDRYIHEPWTMPSETQRAAGCRIGRDYPAPLVDHAAARVRAQARYRAARSVARP